MNAEHPALIVTRDGDLLHVLVNAVSPAPVEVFFDAHSAAQALRSSDFCLAVLDDEVLTESERGWMIDECHRRRPATEIVYVASKHSPVTERLANCHGVALYAAKPIDAAPVEAMIRSLCSRPKAGSIVPTHAALTP